MKNTTFLRTMGAIGALFALGLGVQSAPAAPQGVLENDGLRVQAGSRGQFNIILDGLGFGQNSQFWVVNPPWTTHYYGYNKDLAQDEGIQTTATETGGQILIPMESPTGVFSGTQLIEVLPGRKLRVSVDARLTTSLDHCVLEHQVCEINPNWLTGRPMSWVTAEGKEKSAVIPGEAAGTELKDVKLAEGFRSLRLDTRLGPVDIETTGNAPLTLLDYRRNPSKRGQMVFWFGVLDIPLEPRHHVKYELTMQFPPPHAAQSGAAVTGGKVVSAGAQVVKPEAVPDRVIPTPKKVEWRKADLKLPARFGAAFECDVDGDEARSFCERLVREVAEDAILRGVHVDAVSEPALVKLHLRSGAAAKRFTNSEEYRLEVTPKGVAIDAATTEGLMHGTKTLRQLYRERDGITYVRGCSITDYPTISFRGVLMYHGIGAGPEQAWLMRDIVGALKYSHLLFHANFVKWPSRPELFSGRVGVEVEDARMVAEAARRQHVDSIPFFPAFGLKDWVQYSDTKNPVSGKARHFDSACPQEREIVKDVIRDAIELFKPASYIHIGHDELETETPLLLDSIDQLNKWVRSLGLRTMIWGDVFLYRTESTDAMNARSPEEALERREGIPKDVIVTDWHYADAKPEDYKSLRLFADQGLDVIGCPWDSSENIVNMARAVVLEQKRKAKPGSGSVFGFLQTTWAGWNFNRRAMEENAEQVAAWIVGAEAAWTGGKHPHTALPFDPMKELQRIWNNDALPATGAAGWIVDLGDVANFDLAQGRAKGWYGYETGDSLDGLPAGEGWFGRHRMMVAKGGDGGARGVLLSGRMNPEGEWPSKLTVPVETTATALNFLLAATLAGPSEPPIADTVVHYDDGTSEKLSWRLGHNLYSIDDPRQSGPSPIVWEKRPKGKMPRIVHSYTWPNPHPAKVVDRVEFVSTNATSSMLLLGMNGVQAPARTPGWGYKE